MSMGKQPDALQSEFWIATQDLASSPGHPFYEKLNGVLRTNGFDAFAERRCEKFYKDDGRPGISPGVYFRMLMVGYFEGLDSERGIAWRCADSLTLRGFLGYALSESTPDHSSLSVIRKRFDLRTHKQIFRWVLIVLAKTDLVKGKTVGIDATTLVANAAMKSIVRRDSGHTYEQFLTELARNAGIEDPTREELAKLDRKRKKKTSNDDWFNPHDPDAQVTKLKDGRTHLGHKDEHAVDLDTGAVLGVTVQGGAQGDTSTLVETVGEALDNLNALSDDAQAEAHIADEPLAELVADKGYHSNDTLVDVQGIGTRTYIAEPARGQRVWKGDDEAQKAVYANRRRIRGARGKRLMKRRGELLERPFAHALDTGGMRRVYLRGRENILKRLLIHVAGLNLGLLMRKVFGVGTPRGLQGAGKAFAAAIFVRWRALARGVADGQIRVWVPALPTHVANSRDLSVAA